MRTRQEIKSIARTNLQENYWPCVGARWLGNLVVYIAQVVILGLLLRSLVMTVFSGAASWTDRLAMGPDLDTILQFAALALLLYKPILRLLRAAISGLTGPITIGMNYFFVQTSQGRGKEVSLGTPFQAAFTGFGRKLGGYMWMQLFIYLWRRLFVVPGIVKSFAYALAPYILSDCPNVYAKDALKLSMRMMYGHKADLFVLQLSFILWDLLSAFVPLVNIFYAGPYKCNAFALFYLEVREEALRSGIVTMAELNGEVAAA